MKLTVKEIITLLQNARSQAQDNELQTYRKWVPILQREFDLLIDEIKPPNQVDSVCAYCDGKFLNIKPAILVCEDCGRHKNEQD